jgi:hypothetical protein
MKDIIYSPIVSLILHICMFYFCWTYWSLPVVIVWAILLLLLQSIPIFLVIYSEGRYNWKKFRKQQNKK